MDYTINTIKKAFSERLKELRIQNRLSQKELADILCIRQSSYEQYESKKALPKYDKLIKIAQYFGVSIDYLIGISDI